MALTPLGLLLLAFSRSGLSLASLEFGASRGASTYNAFKSSACSQQLLELLGNPDFDNFTACVDDHLNRSDPLQEGSSAAAYANCWCAGNVSSFIRAQDCASQRNWQWLSKMNCDDDCSSAEARDCAATCPKKCFESTEKLPQCKCAEACLPHLRCLVEDANHSSKEELCGELALASSPMLQTFQDCVRPARSNSTWDMLSNQFSCLCSGDLQEEIHRQHCCDGSNRTVQFINVGLCTANCSVDCASEEARECQSTCTRECAESQMGQPSQDCEDTCLEDSGRCNKYKVCAPAAHTAPASPFHYVCDDGEAPDAQSGCCPGVFGADRCPLLCDVQFKTSFWRWGHSTSRCECDGCPATREETLRLMNETLLKVYEEAAYRQLMYIVVTRNLQGMSNEMRGLFNQQMKAVQTEIILHGGHLDRLLLEELHAISAYYFNRLEDAADAEFITGGQRKFFAQPSFGLVWLALISSIIVILTITLGCLLPKTMRHPWLRQPRGPPENPAELAQNRTVVGRPISSKEQPTLVVEGVLVQQAQTGLASV